MSDETTEMLAKEIDAIVSGEIARRPGYGWVRQGPFGAKYLVNAPLYPGGPDLLDWHLMPEAERKALTETEAWKRWLPRLGKDASRPMHTVRRWTMDDYLRAREARVSQKSGGSWWKRLIGKSA